jgi:ligand-binding SRPBCC domain-containing protein
VITFETDVRIERPIEEVFAYVSNPGNFPYWNSAVSAVRETEPGSTYVMERQLPTGRAVNELKIVALDRSTEFAIRTTSGPTPFSYVYRFSAENGETVVRLDAEVELDGVASLRRQLARRAVKRGVDDNFATLKGILENTSATA